MKMKRVRFDKIKPGKFFRAEGKTLWQARRDNRASAQAVTGPNTGKAQSFVGWLVTPVNAKIVEEK